MTLSAPDMMLTCVWVGLVWPGAGIRCVRVFQAATRRGSQPPQSTAQGGS